jgi:eukaryotic-like serine/threonine-protein kinase
MEQQLTWAAGKSGAEDILLAAQSDTEAYFGRLSSARNLSRRAVDSAVRADSREAAGLWRANAALREAEFGEYQEARSKARQALALAPGRNVQLFAALALARAGESAEAEQIAVELQKRYPDNTVLNVYRLPAVNAALAMKKGNPAQAIALLEISEPYELGEPTPMPLATLYPPYLRGQAYLSLRNGPAAAAEFQKLLDHPGVALNSPLGPLAHLQIARAYAMAGDISKAQTAYQDFFSLWKDADPDIPIMQQAKAEYAKLHAR